ncbi:MAG: hypothetical protein HY738_02070 [Bacteroidia bacterium]|nr:hypothetical protein [Bacteroidia bacterium]
MNIYEKRNTILGMEFDRYIREHPEFGESIPQNAHVVLLIEGDKEFNEWSTKLAIKQAEKNQPIVYVTIKKMVSPQSCIKELELITG